MVLLTVTSAHATTYVLGDSNSLRGGAWADTWAEMYLPDHVSRALPGNSLHAVLSNPSYVTDYAGTDQTWYVMLGTADLKFAGGLLPDVTPSGVLDRMRAVVSLLPATTRVVILTPPSVHDPESYDAQVWEYGGMLLEDPLCVEHECVDTRGLPPWMYVLDGVHLNQDGQDAVVRTVPEPDSRISALCALAALTMLARKGE
jgi:hypothetical protein